MLVATGPIRELGGANPRLAFTDIPDRRMLTVDGESVFALSWWCGTCPYLFERQSGAGNPPAVDGYRDRLTRGLDAVDDDVVAAYGLLLPAGRYLPLLLEISPRQVTPGGPGDFFAEENRATWGLPEAEPKTGTDYYRTFETRLDDDTHLYEFVVPLVPPAWNDPQVVDGHAGRLANGAMPTAVAVSTLDVIDPAWGEEGSDLHTQWCLSHFLLDGHHKMQASARYGRPVRLLALLGLDAGLSTGEDLGRLEGLLGQPAAPRIPRPWFPPAPPPATGWRRWITGWR